MIKSAWSTAALGRRFLPVALGFAPACWAQSVVGGGDSATVPAAAPRQASTTAGLVPGMVTLAGFESGAEVPLGSEFQPRAINQGGVFITLRLAADVGLNSNTLLVPVAAVSSRVEVLRPTVVATVPVGADRYDVGLTAAATRYSDAPTANTTDFEVAVSGQNRFGVRTGVDWRLSYQDAHDPIGSTNRSISALSPDHWLAASAGAQFGYGADGAMGRIEVDTSWAKRRYQNNRATTYAADVDTANLSSRFFYRVAPKTRVLAEARITQSDFTDDTGHLDNTDYKLLVGAEWAASAATSGSARIGYEAKRFSAVRPSFGGLSWEAGVRWLPLSYSLLDIKLVRTTADATGEGSNYSVNTIEQASWQHSWKPYLHSTLGVSQSHLAYNGIARADTTSTWSASLRYDFRRWVRLGLSHEYAQRTSTNSNFDYQRRLTSITSEFAL